MDKEIIFEIIFPLIFRMTIIKLVSLLFSGTRIIIFGALKIGNCPFENGNIFPAILDGMVDSVALNVFEYLKGL